MTGVGPFRGLLALVRLVLGIAIIVYLVSWASPEAVANRLSSVPLRIALLTLGLTLFGQVLIAWRLRLLARFGNIGLAAPRAFSVNLTATFYGVFLPAGNAASLAFRIFRLSAGSTTLGQAIRVVASDRACATVAGAVIGILAYVSLGNPSGMAPLVLLITVAALTGALLWLLLARYGQRALRMLSGIPFLDRLSPSSAAVVEPDEPAKTLLVSQALMLSAGAHLVGCVVWYLLAAAVGIDLSLLSLAWIRSLSLAVALLPFTVAGLGLREGAAVYYLTALGTSSADALALSLAVFAVTVLGIALLGGAIEAVRLLAVDSRNAE